MVTLSAAVVLSLAGLALSDPAQCHGQSCQVEGDQAAMLQSGRLHKTGTDSMIAAKNNGSPGSFCREARDYSCYTKTGLPACCSDGRRKTCGQVKPPCDKKKKGKGKGKGKGRSSRRRMRRSSSRSWGHEVDHTYCSGSYDRQSSRGDAKRACKSDEGCGGVYQPGNDPGSWFLCKGFDTYASNSNSVVIEKLSGSSPLPSPSYDQRRRDSSSSSRSYDDDRRRRARYPSPSPSPSSSCWSSAQAGYCSGSYGQGDAKSAAESACMDAADCGGIYEPGNDPGKWFLCKDFNVYQSTSGSRSIKKECEASPSPSPSYDDDRRRRYDDRRRRDPYPSPSPSRGGLTCRPCSNYDCQSNACSSQNRFMCTSGSARRGCNGDASYWGSTGACDDCCDTSYC